ncbi:MAG: hypothetical protein ACR2O4_14325 [Hyphomicrobiaceae bacterium]
MTRRKLRRNLAVVTVIVSVILAVAAIARLSGFEPLAGLYDYIRDMSLLIATLAAAYLTNIFQQRQNFLHSLRDQWRDIVVTKSALIAFCDMPEPTMPDYLDARAQLSQTIDHMRIVYGNVGETATLIGYYPYEPLHDMRKAIGRLEPRDGQPLGRNERRGVREAIREAFNVLREHFLDEFDLEEPTYPILAPNSRRTKRPGARVEDQDVMSGGVTRTVTPRAS